MDFPSPVSYPDIALYPGGEVVVNGYSFTGPDSGTVGAPSTNFTITANPPGTTFEGDEVFTPGDNSSGGSFNPASVTTTAGQTSVTFTYTAVSAGTRTITVANNQGWSQPMGRTYQATNSGFSPADISGLNIWLDVNQITASDEDPIGTWEDQGPLGRDATSSGGNRPLYYEDGGSPFVGFDGIDDFMQIAAGALVETATILIVTRALPGDTDSYVFDFGNSNQNAIISGFNSNVENFSTPRISVGAVDTDDFHIYCIIRNNGTNSTTTYRDGVQIATSAGRMPITTDALHIGRSTSPGAYYGGDIKGIIVYDSALTGSDFDDVHGWLSAEYGIPLA